MTIGFIGADGPAAVAAEADVTIAILKDDAVVRAALRGNFLDHDFAPGFKVDLHHKDLEIALAASGEVDAPLPLTAAVQQMFRQLRTAGHGEEDDSALLRVAEQGAAHRLGDRP
jgi:3-hydroxyisobutyrate dehydrogenase-like beta-hydroxyacid dehydrogenase